MAWAKSMARPSKYAHLQNGSVTRGADAMETAVGDVMVSQRVICRAVREGLRIKDGKKEQS